MADDDVEHRLREWGFEDGVSPFQARQIIKLQNFEGIHRLFVISKDADVKFDNGL